MAAEGAHGAAGFAEGRGDSVALGGQGLDLEARREGRVQFAPDRDNLIETAAAEHAVDEGVVGEKRAQRRDVGAIEGAT